MSLGFSSLCQCFSHCRWFFVSLSVGFFSVTVLSLSLSHCQSVFVLSPSLSVVFFFSLSHYAGSLFLPLSVGSFSHSRSLFVNRVFLSLSLRERVWERRKIKRLTKRAKKKKKKKKKTGWLTLSLSLVSQFFLSLCQQVFSSSHFDSRVFSSLFDSRVFSFLFVSRVFSSLFVSRVFSLSLSVGFFSLSLCR